MIKISQAILNHFLNIQYSWKMEMDNTLLPSFFKKNNVISTSKSVQIVSEFHQIPPLGYFLQLQFEEEQH